MSLADKDPIRDIADRSIRDSLMHPENLRELLEEVVPNLADHFDVSQREFLQRDFPMEDWRHREADLPFRIPFHLGDETVPALVVVLIEHQSDTDPLMPLRLLYFAVGYWDQQWKDWAALPTPRPKLRLHPVLPIVFYTGESVWGSNRTLMDLMGEPSQFHAYTPDWEPLFWNLSEQIPEEMLAGDRALMHMLSVLRVENEESDRFREVFQQCAIRLQDISQKDEPRWYDLLRILFTWIAWRRPPEEFGELSKIIYEQTPSKQHKKAVEEMISKKLGPSLTDIAKEEGFEEGIEKGREEGIEKGREEGIEKGREEGIEKGIELGYRKSLIFQLSNKFGELPEEVIKLIEKANIEKVEKELGKAWQYKDLRELDLQ